MRRKTRKCLILVLVILLISAPAVLFYRYVNHYAVEDAGERISQYSSRILEHVERILNKGSEDVDNLISSNAIGCDAWSQDRIMTVLDRNRAIQQFIVADPAGAEICNVALRARPVSYMSHVNYISAESQIGLMPNLNTNELRFTYRRWIGARNSVLLVFAPDVFELDILPEAWRGIGIVSLKLDDGGELRVSHAAVEQDPAWHDRLVIGDKSSSLFPLRIQIELPLKIVMQEYEKILQIGTIAVGGLSLLLGLLMLVFVFRPPSLNEELQNAFEDDEFVPFYQPVIDLARGRLEGCEVLVRRRLADGTMVSPVKFIDNLEHSGLIIDVTRDLMRKVRDDLDELCRERPGIHIAFNLCSQHFADDTVVNDIKEIFGDTHIAFERLVFEITERQPLEDLEMVNSVVSKLHDVGCRVSLDDAGTGHAGLAVIQSINFDIIKIDKVFVDAIISEGIEAPLIDTIINLGKTLNKVIIAEGVENMVQLSYLRARGLRFAQGYLFAPPLPREAFINLAYKLGHKGALPMDKDLSDLDIRRAVA